MAINFPNSPVDGSTYTVSGTTFTYNLALGSWRAQVSGATGATAPSGSNTHVQYNNSGAFGSSAGLVFNQNSNTLTIADTVLVGANATINTTSIAVGNTAGNVLITQASIVVGNTTVGVVNAFTFNSGANVSANNTTVKAGNTTVATTLLTLGGQINANGGVGTSAQVLTSGAAGNAYWSTVSASPGGSNTQIQFNNSGAFGGNANFTYDTSSNTLNIANNITFTGNATVYSTQNFNQTSGTNYTQVIGTVGTTSSFGGGGATTKIKMRSGVNGGSNTVYGIFTVDDNDAISQWFSLAANGQFSIGTQGGSTAATYSFGNTSASFGRSTTFNANVVLGTTTISANGGVGSAGQVLTSGATGNVYWSTVSGGGIANGQSVSFANLFVTNISTLNAVSANGGLGSAGQLLTTNGSNVYWSTVSSGGGSLPTTIVIQNTSGSAAAGGSNSFAVGAAANAAANSSIAIGAGAIANGTQESIAIGLNAIASNTAIVIGSNSNTTSGGDAILIGRGISGSVHSGIVIGQAAAIGGGPGGIAIGVSARVQGGQAVAIGYSANAYNAYHIALGSNTSTGVSGNPVVAIGYNANSAGAAGGNTVIVGAGSVVSANNSFVFGPNNTVSAQFAGAIGKDITNTGANTIIIGNNLQTVITGSFIANGALTANGSVVANGSVTVNGSLIAVSKSFDIEHPLDPNKRLRYGSLEGPENGVYVRGRLTNEDTIFLPDYWENLVNINSVTVNLTAIGSPQHLYVISSNNTAVVIGSQSNTDIDCYYTINGERQDIDPLVVEY